MIRIDYNAALDWAFISAAIITLPVWITALFVYSLTIELVENSL